VQKFPSPPLGPFSFSHSGHCGLKRGLCLTQALYSQSGRRLLRFRPSSSLRIFLERRRSVLSWLLTEGFLVQPPQPEVFLRQDFDVTKTPRFVMQFDREDLFHLRVKFWFSFTFLPPLATLAAGRILCLALILPCCSVASSVPRSLIRSGGPSCQMNAPSPFLFRGSSRFPKESPEGFSLFLSF